MNDIEANVKQDKKRLLLHSCCGPCSTAVIERLLDDWDITVFYFNPNIDDPREYEHRRAEQERYLKELDRGVELINGEYDPSVFYACARGLEGEPEGGLRCRECFKLRLFETARTAQRLGFDAFDTTLSVSPHKNYEEIRRAGEAASALHGVEFLAGNYKKKDGYRRSVELAREHGLYRQDFCGCGFSKRESAERKGL